MTILPFPRRPHPGLPSEAYFQQDRGRDTAPNLRTLSALEQMYAYWGSDRDPAPHRN